MLQIPHQIVQSPARLGLPNPNSPSIQNPTPTKLSSQNPQTSQPVNQFTTPGISSTLLPLLPPLPRAQSLLLQMASLSSKLFEVSPNRSHWISAFRGSLPSFLPSQTQSPSPDSSPSTAKEIIVQFTSLQTQLFEAVAELQEILDLQDAKQKLNREIRSKDSALLNFANKLKETEHVLDILVDDYSDYRRPKRTKTVDDDADDSSRTTVETRLKLSDILSYAHKISYTTFAPPEFGAGQAPLRGALPPAPQEEQMRASGLYKVEDIDIGLPKTDEDKETMIEAWIETPAESNPLQGLAPPIGWKPGMPVELPINIPIKPPPGWKPGDPIALPPLESIPPPPRTEEPPMVLVRPGPPPGLPREQETVQVRHVKLDFDDESSGGDESSDAGSSDSED